VQKKIHILNGSAMYPESAECAMREVTERHVRGFRDQNKFLPPYMGFLCIPALAFMPTLGLTQL
jgi:hypothetical protein